MGRQEGVALLGDRGRRGAALAFCSNLKEQPMNTIAKLVIGTFVAGLSVPGLALGGPIHDAARRADIGLVASLVRSGTDINARDANGRTPLIIAAKGGETDFVQKLLK